MLGGVTLLAAAAGYRLGVLGKIAETATMTAPAQPIPELALTDLKGQPQSLGQWRGKLLVVNYWATWCHPCRQEMPGFSRLQDKYRDKDVQFVGIGIDHADKIEEFQKTTPVSYPLLIGDIGAMENSVELGNSRKALPFTVVFDRRGELFLTKLGRFTETDLEQHLIELISR
ncbi:MAG: TlpA family protein disulfide reductase [Sulfuritalea sp.]|nr:TlpA family protein disulfide reductase [Sulfuritalea sp.]